MGGMVCAYGGWRCGGGGRGNLRVAKTPPLQSALRGGGCGYAAPIVICALMGINENGMKAR